MARVLGSKVRPGRVARSSGSIGFRLRRAYVLPASGAIIGALLAGLGLFRSVPYSVDTVPPGYVALVNNKGILMSDFVDQTKTTTGKPFADSTPEERKKTLTDMIDEELLVQRGLVLDLPETTTEVRTTMASAVNAQVDVGLEGRPPTDAQLRAFYDVHRENYSSSGAMTVHDLVLHVGGYENADQSNAQAETDAAEAVYQLRAGATIQYAIDHFGFVESGRMHSGEELDFAAKIHLGEKLFSIADGMVDGQISEPLIDADGVHVLVMERRRAPQVEDFGRARARVYGDYKAAAAKHAEEESLKVLRGEAKILVAPRLTE